MPELSQSLTKTTSLGAALRYRSTAPRDDRDSRFLFPESQVFYMRTHKHGDEVGSRIPKGFAGHIVVDRTTIDF